MLLRARSPNDRPDAKDECVAKAMDVVRHTFQVNLPVSSDSERLFGPFTIMYKCIQDHNIFWYSINILRRVLCENNVLFNNNAFFNKKVLLFAKK